MTPLNSFPNMVMKAIAILLAASLFLTSCKKDKEVIPSSNAAVEGLYTGIYGFGDEVPDAPEKYNVKAGGIFQQISIHNGTVIGSGTWSLNGNNFKGTSTSVFAPYSKTSISAVFNNTAKKLTGTWGWDNNYSNGGRIELAK